MVKQSVLWRKIQTHYSIVPLDQSSTCKNTKYQCNYCLQIYASNVTRMSIHLMKDCPAPMTVKQEIRNIYAKIETSSASSHKHFKLNARWTHVSQHYVKLNADNFPNCKKEKYMCIYCNNRYANNVTRMAQHVMECARCPCETKNEFYKLSKPKNSSVLSTLPHTFHLSSLEKRDEDDVDDDDDSMFLYAAGFENDDTIDPISSNSFDGEMEPLEEKYDITEHLVEGIENIETNSSFKMDTREIDEDEIKTLIARACYSTSTPLNIFENTHWQKLFNTIAPNLSLPTQNELSEKYLNKEYNIISKEVANKIKDASKLSIQLIGNNERNLTSVVVVLTTPEPVVYDILEIKSSGISSIENTINKIIQENSKHTFYPIVCKNTDNLDFNKQPFTEENISCYTCNKHILSLLIRDLMELDQFKNVLQKYKTMAGDINLDKTFCLKSNKHWTTLKRTLESQSKTPKNKITLDDDTSFWTKIRLFVNLIEAITNWMNKIKIDSCLSTVVECYSDLRETFKKVVKELDQSVLQCLDKHRSLAITEMHKAASLLDPRYMGTNLSADEVIDAIEFINKLAQIQPDVRADKIIYDIAAYRTKQGIWGKKFVWDSLEAPEVPAVIWWQSMCASTELSKIAVNVLNCPPVTVPVKHETNKSKSGLFRKIQYVRHNIMLTTEENHVRDEETSDNSDDC